MSAQLFVVATPIGHLDDMSYRAIDVLKSVSLIAAEDTRTSAQLMKHFNISTPLTACHEHNESNKIDILVQKLLNGEDIALISDAGTPLISDPGFKLVRAAQANGIRVIPVPGACAAIAALSAVGLPSDRFSFQGFLASKQSQRLQQLEKLKDETQTLIFYEAPHRILDSVKDMAAVFGADRPVGFAREITKTFETIKKMTLGELAEFIAADHHQQKGEIVLVVGGASEEKDMEQEKLDQLLQRLLQDLSVKAASQLAADLTGIKKKIAYQRALELSQAAE
ncbi:MULTISPECIES: 16S rRNA (cytidine(1402)-2'-O)-methyltransferase [Acinetobacter]|jgi:16S rRNA (cytidine1402-2'-O)-methyltransferase|uniref:Ribosomal RNA small subunit methyltransferase I n=1 Tax=Acinetobacter towneri TaxID=202956 RepID=A0AAP4HFL9_9GAMM|nr:MULTISPECIES: 16S rRNA (cytidine(1402)-2'-O)-methyltransferase [Acinetobacter]MDM1283840.1 16S rRNA (cytidine(1402)-2'-O)-methyltransferase [Acinetobacter towneri]MDM1719708.1 16S rRNA (cytidine(1402)-2'-O)-methyltransferase [Acinetobacter towneri]MDM1731550.1 16S rRNA (cytidine(1402)-2'-O)-methyltransferase [Acinetobacter towneri]MDM1733471.1 16S rRNA (cytidine(1402)-2'-O)-methyltransferase [Acinetobacter towneri]MDM1737013.1 16S rRNA (cytidine(1402)-2'-O)-methyltransferase [Acinetobacter 